MGGTEPTAVPLPVRPGQLDAIARRGVTVPRYDRSQLRRRIVHIGVGGFHRAHLAAYTNDAAGHRSDWGIHGLGLLAGDAAMAAALGEQSGLYTLIERGDGADPPAIVGSLVDYTLCADDPDAAVAAIAAPDVAIVSLTITEGGYGPQGAATFATLAAGLAARRAVVAAPVTVLSCDNLPGNGAAARAATLAAAANHDAGDGDGGLAAWIEQHCTFPNSMVDRITPATSDDDRRRLATEFGVDDRWPVVAEPFRQWVVEDRFAAGRPPWESVGVQFTDDVASWELYKLRILNAAHSCMAYLCALAGFEFVDEAIADDVVAGYLRRLLDDEAIPSLDPIPGHPPADYAAVVLHRFANRAVRDQIARLCIGGTAKFPTFLIPTVAHHVAADGPVRCAALALAGWARYLATVPVAEQADDELGAAVRELAGAAAADPARFLAADVFTAPLRASGRFREAFVDGYGAIERDGPRAAMAAAASG